MLGWVAREVEPREEWVGGAAGAGRYPAPRPRAAEHSWHDLERLEELEARDVHRQAALGKRRRTGGAGDEAGDGPGRRRTWHHDRQVGHDDGREKADAEMPRPVDQVQELVGAVPSLKEGGLNHGGKFPPNGSSSAAFEQIGQ